MMFKKSVILFISLLAVAAVAQNVQLGMSRPPYYKGCPFTFQIVVSDGELTQPPVIADTENYTVEAHQPNTSTNTSISIINGRRSEKKSTRVFDNRY